ncbi:family 78 glycoside hydrolase catalytic domain [Paenibacillus terrigena]|uniref:family 78 glycoside hydrolase catalytic domain n=1 Tax=Paenibacillus terrigena TaxID=369333 RepID=UPI000360EDEA|nr:family 78 glycoside hydrolase catalytic domain [Paenibacillus terrigena]
MNQAISSDWQAAWIWGSGQQSPRNEWRCFRRSFIPMNPIEGSTVRITADSRYVLFVNGKQLGRGPVRSWHSEWAYDEYEIEHLLEPGKEAVIAVLVMHYGISTFQYLRGRGGLLLQLEMQQHGADTDKFMANSSRIVTDASWKTAIHQGYQANSSRISCQLAFTEVIDARTWDASWIQPEYDDSDWEEATVIGPAGMEPWAGLVARDIPYLTEEPVYPSRVESILGVKPPAWSAVVDLYALVSPNSGNHANNVAFCGYLATKLILEHADVFTIGIPDSGRIDPVIRIDGRLYPVDSYTGEEPERYLTVHLEPGDHFILIDVTGCSHGHGFHIGFDCEMPFQIQTLGLKDGETGTSPFSLIGPFDAVEIIDHQQARDLVKFHSVYEAIKTASSAADMQPFEAWIHPIAEQFVNLNDVFTSCIWKKCEVPQPMTSSLQHAVTAGADAALLPVIHGMDTEIVIDFGRELSGYIAFELNAASGTIVDLYGFEYMKEGWRQHTYSLDNTIRYVCREGRQTYVSFIRRGLRYLTLTIREASRPVKLYEVKLLQSNYPVANVGGFRSSDPMLSDIWVISRDTTRLCMEDTFVDCPAYEQAYWVGDARNEALINYYTFGAREIVERCLKLVPGSASQTSLYADQVPSGWNSVIPNWTFFWVTACLEYYRYDGRQAFLNEIWPHVKLTMEAYLHHINDKGVFVFHGWNLLDWAPFEQPREGVVTPQNMILARTLRHAAEIGALVGERDQVSRFEEEAEKLIRAINEYLWDEERLAYVDCIHSDGSLSSTLSAQTQIVAFLCDIAKGDRLEIIKPYIIETPKDFVQVGSPFMSFFYYEALAKMGRLDMLMKDMQCNYGFMIENDATTCWEMYPWSGFYTNPKVMTRSHCHAWSAGPAYFLGAYVLGVQGVTPGWSKVRVAPEPCGLRWASGSVPLPHGGRIDVSWRVEEAGLLKLRIEAPPEVEIITEAPKGYELRVEYRSKNSSNREVESK